LKQEKNMSIIPEKSPAQALAEPTQTSAVPHLGALYLYIAGSCNLACKHCWIVPNYLPGKNGNDISNGKFLKFELFRKLIDDAKPLGLNTVKLTGGEPLLHPRVRDMLAVIRDEGLALTIETNGTLIDEELADLIQQCQRPRISVSLDGAKAETHDALRGVEGSHAQAINGIRILASRGFHPQVICTLHQGNVSELEELVALAEDLGCGSVKFNHVQRIGRGEQFGNKSGFDVDEIIHLYRRIQRDVVPHTKLRIIFDIPVAFHPIGSMLDMPNMSCSVQTILGVLGTGELALCGIGVTIPDLIYGHLEKDDLQDIWYNHPRLRALREQIPSQLEGICSECIHQYACQGHCVANNYHMSGKLNAPFQFCQRADELGLFPESRKKLYSSH
jgi:SynChlorMet cassette radical SAM/SPASM protein ScmF